MKKLVHFLKVWDGLWSIPIAILFFTGIGYGIVSIFGPEAGFMLPVYLQRLFYAALCLVVCNFVCLFGMYMNFRGIFKYYLSEKLCDEFGQLDAKFKFKMVLVIYFAYFLFFTLFLILV